MTPLEILASILITLGIVKLVVIMVSPNSWLNFARKIYAKPKITSIIALLLALVVLQQLMAAGFTIIEIFAIGLFISLLFMASMVPFMSILIVYVKKHGLKKSIQEQWLPTLVWILLMLWGLKELIT